jgi:DNA-binding transcriptional ArsR family regulator
MDISAALLALGALSQETRLSVFRLLARAGPEGLAAGDIASALHARQNTMSSHLKRLAAAGLVKSLRDGRSVIYCVDFNTAQELILFLMQDCCGGNSAVCDAVANTLSVRCA